MAQDEMLLFRGRNRIRYGYARWGYTRGGGQNVARRRGRGGAGRHHHPHARLWAGRKSAMPFPARWRRRGGWRRAPGTPTWEWGFMCA